MITIYGIPNCDTMKKARRWLAENGVEYEFHDYRKLGVPEKELRSWVEQLGWENLLNKRGTTWRKLDDHTRNNIDQVSAIRIMTENPSIIKRPVLAADGTLLVGFRPQDYEQLLR